MTGAPPPIAGAFRRQPSPAELAAIVAAVEAAWPRPAPPPLVRPLPNFDSWRWSGRWWAPREVAARRVRPGR